MDIFQSIKSARIQRAGLVPEVVRNWLPCCLYAYIYRAGLVPEVVRSCYNSLDGKALCTSIHVL